MLVLDVTVVNVALPRIQHDLGFSRPGLAWVVNAYVVMAGGLLLLGGRLADIFGRRRLFLLGVVVFALASAGCGAAADPAMLIAFRFAQGTGEAMAAPAALGMIALLFPDTKERIKAIGIWGGLSGLAGVSGVIISGTLTDLASWRWIFFINVPIALFALIMVPRLAAESRMVREAHRLDYAGAVTATGGLLLLVYGLNEAASHPWGSWHVLAPLAGGAVLLATMVLVEGRTGDPLVPLRFFANRTRVIANLSTMLFGAAFVAYFFLMTLFVQQILGYSPLKAGLCYLPFGVSIGVGIGVGSGLMPKLGVKPTLTAGFLGAALAMFLTGGIDANSGYAGGVLPGMILLGVSSGLVMPAGTNAALHKITGQDSGLASGVQNTVQQVGAALGLSTLVTLALRHATHRIAAGARPDAAAADGYALAFRVSAAGLVVGAVLVLALLEHVIATPRNPLADEDDQPEPGRDDQSEPGKEKA
jgi:EmrB/QacA subfamily drug resistance transporter